MTLEWQRRSHQPRGKGGEMTCCCSTFGGSIYSSLRIQNTKVNPDCRLKQHGHTDHLGSMVEGLPTGMLQIPSYVALVCIK